MKIVPASTRFIALTALSLGVLTTHAAPSFGQERAERFWVAGRYDGNRIIVYFDKVKFAGTMASKARKIASPVMEGFFSPVELPANYIAGFQKIPSAEHFSVGDRYDLMLGNGEVATVKLTTLVGCETDEEVGNDSFIGALATTEPASILELTKGYYAVRRHREPKRDEVKPAPETTADYLKHASLVDEPVRFDVQTQIAALLDLSMKVEATGAEKLLAGGVAPALKVQPFRVANGSLRYYVRAEWKSGKENRSQYPFTLGAWIAPLPTPHILVLEKRPSDFYAIEDGLPDLLNVVDLGAGRTGVIFHVSYGETIALDLAEYRDGVGTQSMRTLQVLSVGE